MRFIRKLDWKKKVILSILGGVWLVIFVLFGITYYYFVSRLSASNEQITRMSFQEAETNIGDLIGAAEMCLSRLSNNRNAWEFSSGEYGSSTQRSISIRTLVYNFDKMTTENSGISGFAIWSGDGRCAVSTMEKSRTGFVQPRGEQEELLRRSRENYPYVLWVGSAQADFPENVPLGFLSEKPALLGFKALGEASDYLEDSYLIAALDEESIRHNFGQPLYSDACSALLDGEGTILSSTDPQLLGTAYAPDSQDQNIEYPLSYNNWSLVCMIPKESYRREARGIRIVGLTLGLIALVAVAVFAVIWGRRYTRPIQILMEQFDSVGRGQLDIPEPEKTGWPELAKLNEEFYLTVQKLREYIARLTEAEQQKAQEELRTLQYQINPHFLYNSLNSIRWMAMMTNSTRVADSLASLSRLIMPILRNPSFTWTLQEELDFLDHYVEMMSLRYGNCMEYHTECDRSLYGETFPRFILQPVIENCFEHGSCATEIRQVIVRIRRPERFQIEIQNTGVFLGEEEVYAVNSRIENGVSSGKNLGLVNVRRRLTLLYGEDALVRLESSPDTGVTVRIEF